MNIQNATENISLFDDEISENAQLATSVTPKLDVVKAEFQEVQTLTWEELFFGF